MNISRPEDCPLSVVDALKAEGRWLDAAAAYVETVKEDITSASRWVQLGHLLKDGRALDDAGNAYRSAILCDGTDGDPRLHLAHLLKRQDRLAEALETFRDLDALPHAPDVSQEIAGLTVALLPVNRTTESPADPERLPERPAGLVEALQALKALQAAAFQQGEHEAAEAKMPPARRILRGRDLRPRLMPRAHLVIRDDILVATTANPQFDLICEEPCEPGWVEIDVGIEADVPFIEPVFYAEHAPRWQAFSFARLAQRDGRFHAVCRLDAPVTSLRLDPLTFEAPFAVTHVSLRQIGISSVLKCAWKQAPDATRRALLGWYRHKSLATVRQDLAAILSTPGLDAYQRWTARHGFPGTAQIAAETRRAERWPKRPAFAILLRLDPADPSSLGETLATLVGQSYPDWSLRLVPHRTPTQSERHAIDTHCKTVGKSVSIHADPRTACEGLDTGFIVPVRAGDRLLPSALFRMAEAIYARSGIRLVYCDEDHLRDGSRCLPLLKPDWDPDFQASADYVGSFFALRHDVALGALAAAPTTSGWDDTIPQALCALPEEAVMHMSEILHERRLPIEPDAAALPARSGPAHPDRWPRVSVIIPTRDSADVLRPCIDTLLSHTDYPDLDIVIVDNGSTDPATLAYFADLDGTPNMSVLAVPGAFNFARLNNIAIAQATGDIVALVNNDIRVFETGWLKAMVAQAVRPEIGAVGAKLLYPSGHVQHAGIACGVGLVAAHPHKFRTGDDPGYMNLLVSPHRVMAVTAACLVVERRKYIEVGGMDEDHLQIAFNDVDLCLKLDAKGYRNLFTPHARLTHLESATRGLDLTPQKAARYLREADIMLARWENVIGRDRYYNIHLTREREDYTIGV